VRTTFPPGRKVPMGPSHSGRTEVREKKRGGKNFLPAQERKNPRLQQGAGEDEKERKTAPDRPRAKKKGGRKGKGKKKEKNETHCASQ